MQRFWSTFSVMALALAICQPRAEAQGPISATGLISSAEEAKKDKSHDDPKDKHDEGHDHGGHQHHEPPDLGLRDFLTSGWTDKFEERERQGRAPRFNLFKTRQGFLERIVAVNYGFQYRVEHGQFDEHEAAVGIEYALNRRFEIDIEPLYTWKFARGDRRSQDGLRWETGLRFQLIDTADWAVNYQVRVATPNSHVDQRQTGIGSVLAGFNDLTKLGLRRTGVYYHFEYQALAGPRDEEPEAEGLPPGQKASSRITYALAFAKTLIDRPAPLVSDLTIFVEGFGATNLNGSRRNETYFSFTPGIRMNLSGREEKAWWLQGGYEIPVTGPRALDMGFRLSLIRDF